MKVAVIGTGISGLSVARILQSDHEVVLFERNEKIGGLIKCERVNDCLFHKVGGHVFNSKNKKVLDWFWNHFDKDSEFIQAKRNAKVLFNNQVIGYPFENFLYLLDKETVRKVIGELLALNKQPAKSPFNYESFEAFLKGNFGETLFEIYFKPYNNKIWKTDLSSVSMEWLEGKLPMPNLEDMLVSNIVKQEETNMVHATFYYAKEGGSQFIVDRLAEGLDIRSGVEVKQTVKDANGYTVAGESGFDAIVYCGDIRKVPEDWKQLLSNENVDASFMDRLRANGTSNLFCETDKTDISWLYIPQDFTKAHRIIYTGNFSDTNNRGSKRDTCVVEFSGKVDYETMVEEIKSLPGNLSPISYNYEPNSYVVQDKTTRPSINAVKEVFEKNDIYLLGRFAEWEYYNMDKAIEAAFDVAEKINNKKR